MKSLNSLYYFIKHRDPKSPGFKEDREGNAYFLQALLVNQDALADYQAVAYVLKEHHLSFYEKQDNNKAWLSSCHYTAKIVDAEGQEYKLHVYFSDTGTIKDVVLLKPLSDGNYQKQTIDANLKAWFEEIAIQHSLNQLMTLRQELQEHVKLLEDRYDAVEKELSALSQDLNNQQIYQQKLDEIIQILSLLYFYNAFYQPIYNYFIKTREQVVSQVMTATHAVVAGQSAEKAQDLATSSFSLASNPEAIAPNNDNLQLANLLERIRGAKAKAEAAKKLKYPEQVPLAVEYLNLCAEANLLLEEKRDATQGQLQEIQKLYSESLRQAKVLLNTLLLISGDTGPAAEALKNLTPLLSPKNIVHAVIKGKAELLDFLLTHGHVDVNSLQIEKQQVLHYCLQHQADSTMPKVLSVLIKHGVSLMIKAPDGLPVAHHILNGPLKAALVDHTQTTLSSPAFYSRLSFSIENYLKNNSVSNDQRKSLQAAISSYQQARSTIGEMSVDEKTRDRYVQAGASMTAYILQQMQFNQDNYQRDLSNQAYQGKLIQLQKVSQDLMKQMSKKQVNMSIKAIEGMKKVISEDMQEMKVEVADIKKKIIQIDDYIQLCRLLTQKTALENSLDETKNSAKFKKANKANAAELSKIQTAITEIMLKWHLMADPDMPDHLKSLIGLKIEDATIEQMAFVFPNLLNKIKNGDRDIEEDEIQEFTQLMKLHLGLEKSREMLKLAKALFDSPGCKVVREKLAEFSRSEITALLYSYVIGNGQGKVRVKKGNDSFLLLLSNTGTYIASGALNPVRGLDVGQRFEFRVIQIAPAVHAETTPSRTPALAK